MMKNRFPDNPHTWRYLQGFRAEAEGYRARPIEALPYSKYQLFQETGSRVEYETVYFERRRRLDVLFAMVMTGDERFLPLLEDILFAICSEFSWALPAHTAWEKDPGRVATTIDLFAAETAFALAEIDDALGDLLSPLLRSIVRNELERRILVPYRAEELRFGVSNWSAVCAAGVIAVLCHLDRRDDLELLAPRLRRNLDDFLSSFAEDGCCLEGGLYWSYGFGYFVSAADLLKKVTAGETDLFRLPKVERIASFGAEMYLAGNAVVPYSDAPHLLNHNIGLYHYLKKRYPGLFLPSSRFEARFGDENRYRFAEFHRNIIWYDPVLDAEGEGKLPARTDYPVSQWFIRRTGRYAFSCKGGHNGEPHNHDDLGSFVVLREGRFLLDDLGWPEYDKTYFNPGSRYKDYLCAMSEGHSLPILDGHGQAPGADHRAKVIRCEADEIVLDLSRAYDLTGLRFTRTFRLSDDKIVIEDAIDGIGGTVVERFVTQVEPQVSADGAVRIGDVRLVPALPVGPSVGRESFTRRSVCVADPGDLRSTAFLIDYRYRGCGRYAFTLQLP